MLSPGDRLDHYIVEAFVGGGGMARVFRVRHAILDHTMALKVLEPRWVAHERVRLRFLAEGRIMARVRHPAIVMVTDAVVDADRGIAGLVMEFVEGPDLARVIGRMRGPPDVRFVRDVTLPILDAVHHVHQEGVVHRDLKPANVLLSRDAAGHWYPRVTDFGIAWVASHARINATRPPTRERGLVGTPAYMAPEQASGRGRPEPSWDVWALGVILYELATGGVHPFERGDETATLDAVQAGRYTPITEVHPGVHPSIAAAVHGALQRDPEQRFRSAAGLAEVLSGRATLAADPRAAVSVVAEWEDEDAFPDPGHAVVDAPKAVLELASGEGGAMRFHLDEVSIVGAADGATVRLALPGVEPEHCEIRHDHGRWLLVDHSIAGSRVNGARVPRIQLADGDLVRLGTAVLRFRLGEGPSATTPPPTVPPDTHTGPWLEVPDVGGTRRFPLGLAPVVLGRSPGADIVLDDPAVSLRHARVTLQGRDILIEDLHSHNGVTVNGQRARFRRLNPGDEVRLGQVLVRLVV